MRLRSARLSISLLSLLVVQILALPDAFASTGQHASLIGQVVDKDGTPMPGVTVTASSSVPAPNGGTVTNGEGRYRISPLPPASDYVVLAELPGFAKVEVSPIHLNAGKTTTQNFSMIPATDATDRVTVTAKGDIVDVSSTKTATVFNSEFIDDLPIVGRAYTDLLTLAPGVTDIDGDGNPNVNGARETDFQTRMDGANTTDPVTGTFGQNLNLETISEIEIITTGASAEFSQAQGGFANIITKSGGNDFEGSFKFYFRSDLFDNDGANNNDVSYGNLGAEVDGFRDVRPVLTVGGPFVKDKFWYFVSLEYISTEVPLNFLTSSVLQTEDGWNNFLKFTWQINPANRLSAQVNTDPRRYGGLGLGTGVALESDAYVDVGGSTTTLRWTYNISPSVLLETLVSRLDTGLEILPVSDPGPCPLGTNGVCDPFREDLYNVDQNAGITTGPYYETYRDERTRNTLKSDLSIFLDTAHGSHNIKTGFEFADEGYRGTDQIDTIRYENYTTLGGIGGGVITPGSVAGSIDFEDYFPASQSFEATKENWGLYVQDSYKPRPNLSINVGLRYDREDARSEGYVPFDPIAEAAIFVERYCLANDIDPCEGIDLHGAFQNPTVPGDLNGDGKDTQHCFPYDLDEDPGIDDYCLLFDGNGDGKLDDPIWDLCLGPCCGDPSAAAVPDGLPDGAFINPACDQVSDDTFYLLSSFSRHQFDETAEPFEALLQLVPDRDGDGIPARCPVSPDPKFPDYEPGVDCVEGEMLDPDDYPGKTRVREDFRITNDNIAPRIAVSWDPGANNKTKLFATWGRYYDKLFLGTIVPELGPDPRTIQYDANDRNLGSDAPILQVGRFSLSQIDRGMRTPYTDEFTVGFERELAPEWSFGFTYIRRWGRDQLQDIDINHYTVDLAPGGVGDGNPDDFFGRVTVVQGDGSNPGGYALAPDGMADLYALNPMLNRTFLVGNFNISDYEAYQLVFTRRLSRNWQMNASYVYSEATGNAESFQSALGDDAGTVEDEYGPLAYDQTHVVKFNAVTHLPANQMVGTTIQWATGVPFSVIRTGQSTDSMGSSGSRTVYPTGQRNDQRNEGAWLVNLSWRKNFTMDKANASVGVEVDNLLNSDDITIFSVNQSSFVSTNAVRRFGRRWQLSFQLFF